MHENNWQSVWNKRKTNVDNFTTLDDSQLVMELKHLDGFDILNSQGGGVAFKDWIEDRDEVMKYLCLHDKDVKSVFEVGCGCGANIYLMKMLGLEIGGIDYSEALITILKSVPQLADVRECICGEAKDLPTDIKYDAVISSSVFHYFYDLDYAKVVLQKMVTKANKSVGVLLVHDKDMEDEFLNFRRQLNPNYDEHYRGLPKLHYRRDFFTQFATENNLKIEFTDCQLKGFWDAPYVYNCFIYK